MIWMHLICDDFNFMSGWLKSLSCLVSTTFLSMIMTLHISCVWHYSLQLLIDKNRAKKTKKQHVVEDGRLYLSSKVPFNHLAISYRMFSTMALYSKWRQARLFTDTVIWFSIKKACSVIQPRTHNLSISTILPFVIFCCHGCRGKDGALWILEMEE